jgi:hypothetical protein
MLSAVITKGYSLFFWEHLRFGLCLDAADPSHYLWLDCVALGDGLK